MTRPDGEAKISDKGFGRSLAGSLIGRSSEAEPPEAMNPLIRIASPREIGALRQLSFLTAEDLAAVCMRWLEEDPDGCDAQIAAVAGDTKLILSELSPTFWRVFDRIAGPSMDRDEAILRALRLHLLEILQSEDLLAAVQRMISRFGAISDHRLVWHPNRAKDQLDGTYAEQDLGLEYIYGGYYAFEDLEHVSWRKRSLARAELLTDLRNAVGQLHDHLSVVLGD